MGKKNSLYHRILNIILRTFLAAAVIGVLVFMRKDQLRQCLAHFDYRWVIPAFLCLLFHIAVGAWRWRRLTELQGFRLSLFEAYSLTMQGCFFSLVIPGGAIGGDVAKMGLLARRSTPGCRAEGIFTIFMDRVIGMIALFLLCIILLALSWKQLITLQVPGVEHSGNDILLCLILLFLMCLAGIVCGIAVFFHRKLKKIPGVTPLLNWIDRHTGNAASRMTAMADLYANSPGTLTMLTAVSIFFVHIMSMLPMFFLLAGTGIEFTPQIILLTLTAVAIGNIAGLIPLTPGGIGLRDWTVITLLGACGIGGGYGETAQLMATGISVFTNLLGGIFLITDHNGANKSTRKCNTIHEPDTVEHLP